ncbi:MAG: UDP-N-acetylmuramate--L-alanine ligase, partial [Ktedonobacteraceae bacterium]|nr:UDP-N-acetylmuramate--L-alanine ligase [Ktedonobacteraceae bacterium]
MKTSHLHFMGIGGQGISAVAQMALLAGDIVTGCDQQQSATTYAMQQAGIPVCIGHDASHLESVDTLVLSPAVAALNPRNPELLTAQERGIRVVTWQELLGQLMQGKCVLSVCGVHGKGTTTALLALMLIDAGLDPTVEIGAVVPRFGANYRLGRSQYFVNEADEFNHNFWHYSPRLAVVTSIEFEHPEFFADYAALLDAFEHFIRGMDMQHDWPLPPTLVLNADSPGCLHLLRRLHDWRGRIIFYRVENALFNDTISRATNTDNATFEAYDVQLDGETSFRVRVNGQPLVEHAIRLQLPGMHNIQNALVALATAYTVGASVETIVRTLEQFSGIRRRFEIRHQGALHIDERVLDVIIIDDYAHHPTAIAATLQAARRRYPQRRLIALYQPHMYSRTKTFFTQFLSAFDAADVAIISDIFPARERDTGLVHARDVVAAMAQQPHFRQGGAQVLYGADVQATTDALSKILRSGDLVVIMGARDIYTVTVSILGSS